MLIWANWNSLHKLGSRLLWLNSDSKWQHKILHKFFSITLQSELVFSCSMFKDAFKKHIQINIQTKPYRILMKLLITDLLPVYFLKPPKYKRIVYFKQNFVKIQHFFWKNQISALRFVVFWWDFRWHGNRWEKPPSAIICLLLIENCASTVQIQYTSMDSLPNQLGYLLLDEDGAVIAVCVFNLISHCNTFKYC